MSDRDYFAGCHNVPMFDADAYLADVNYAALLNADDERGGYRLANEMVDAFGVLPSKELRDNPYGVTMADVVRAIDARRDCTVGGQLALPAEYMPVPVDRLFS